MTSYSNKVMLDVLTNTFNVFGPPSVGPKALMAWREPPPTLQPASTWARKEVWKPSPQSASGVITSPSSCCAVLGQSQPPRADSPVGDTSAEQMAEAQRLRAEEAATGTERPPQEEAGEVDGFFQVINAYPEERQTRHRRVNPDEGLADGSSSEDEEAVKARAGFNTRHKAFSGTARGVLSFEDSASPRGPTPSYFGPASARRLGDNIIEIRRNRPVMNVKCEPTTAGIPPRPPQRFEYRPRKKWHLSNSIWHPRRLSGNSRDYYEGGALSALFDLDWHVAIKAHGLADAIGKATHGHSAEASTKHASIDNVRAVLADRIGLLYGLFDYYAALKEDPRDAFGELNVFSITFNSFIQFLRDCHVIGHDCPASKVEIVWVQVNVLDESTKQIDRFNHRCLMVRHEFIEALVRIAILKYIQSGQETKAAHAVLRLLALIEEHAPAEAKQNSDAFRKKCCYTELTDVELCKKKPSLQSLYDVYARVNNNVADSLQSQKLMSIGEWIEFCTQVGLLKSNQLSLFGAKMIFLWSRMRSSKDYRNSSEMRLRNLTFEDFLEAVVRVAHSIALPTDVEIQEAKVQDAGEFLRVLAIDQDAITRFVNARKTGWKQEPRQRINRCIAHLISHLVCTVKNLRGLQDGMLTETEVTSFERMCRRGCTFSQLQSDSALLDGVQASAAIVRERLLQALHKVELFSELSADMLERLIDAMVDAPFKQGEYVFEQGDDGDAFFVITEGEAIIEREHEPGQEPTILAEVAEGAYFGERALLKAERRYASIRTKSLKLHCMCVRREGLETALGCKLEEMVPDKYRLDRRELLSRLREVELFKSLNPAQIETVADEMVESTFPRGGWVFKQNDIGDRFHIITSGEADVFRTELGADKPTKISELKQWSFFGERALMTDERRYGGIRATSPQLKTLSIDRATFEAELGPLKEHLKTVNYKSRLPRTMRKI